jgi:signal transduction histidine kinase
MQRVLEEGREALQGLRSSRSGSLSIEEALSQLGEDLSISRGAGFRVFVMGKPQVLNEMVKDQIFLVAREALVNALRHSGATKVEAEVEYRMGKVRVIVRDNGCGIDADVLRSGRECHWGLLGMRERAAGIGGRLRVLSRPGAGTEVEISVAIDIATNGHGYVQESAKLQDLVVA